MELSFTIGTEPAVLRWKGQTGRVEIVVGQERIELQNPWRLSTQFQVSTQRTWKREVQGHSVRVTKVRPRVLAGLRPSTFTVIVDGEVVANGTGM